MGSLAGLLSGILPMLLLLPFVGGIIWAGKFCKHGLAQFFVGILIGLGILCVLLGVAFAGCLIIASQYR